MKNFLLYVLLTVCWVALRLPSIPQAIMDADSGHQLAGATQILHGQHPFVDFDATYGPFVFYASALAQVIFGGRFLGEMILCTFGYAIAYSLLAVLMSRISSRKSLVFLLATLALLVMPRLYKYYIVLGPVLTLFFTYRYIDRPNPGRLFWLALAVTIAGLFRADLGMYCTVAVTVTVVLTPPGGSTVFKRLATLYAFIVLWALPWLLFVTLSGGLFRYFYDSFAGSLNIATGMSLQFPVFQSNQPIYSETNLLMLISVFFLAIPVMVVLFIALRWPALTINRRTMLLATLVLYALSLLQAISRPDTPHLFQTMPLAFLLAVWMLDDLLLSFKPLALLLMLLFFSPILLTGRSGWTPISLLELPQKVTQFALPKEQMLKNVNAVGRLGYVTTMLYIRRCTRAPQRLMALPALTTFPYFTDRAFGGRQIGLVSGYFVTQADQQRFVATIQKEDIPLIVYLPNFAYDGLPERTLEVVAPLVANYIQSNYVLLKEIGALHLLLRRDLTVTQQGAVLDDYSCPIARTE